MADNPYTALIQSDPTAAPDNPYTGLVDASASTPQRVAVMQSANSNPDVEAGLQSLAKQYGVPVDSVRLQQPAYQRQAAVDSINYPALAARAPTVSEMLANPQIAAVSHDDTVPLANTEQAVQRLAPTGFNSSDNYTVPLPGSDVAFSAHGVMPTLVPDNTPPTYMARMVDWARGMLGMGPSQSGNATGAGGAAAFVQQYAKENNIPVGAAYQEMSGALGGQSEVPVQAAQGFENAFTAGLAPDSNGPAMTTQGQIASGVGNLAGFIAGLPLRAGALAVDKIGGSVLAHVEGESFAKAVVKDAATQASTLGIASGITATGQALDTTNPTDALRAVASASEGGALMGGVFGVAGRVLPDATITQAIARAVGVNAALDAINGTNPFDNRPTAQKVFDYGLNTMFSLGGAGRVTGGWLQDAARADIAAADSVKLGGLADAAASSKLRERDPDTFHDFIAAANQDGPVQNVYVDGTTLANALAQSGVKMEDIAGKMPRVAEQLPIALSTGGDVSIPVEDFATYIAGSKAQDAIMPHLKTDPDGMTFEQANEFHQSSVEQFAKAADEAQQQQVAQQARVDAGAPVHDDILQQLNTANRFTPDVNQTYAAIVRDAYTASAERAGVSPAELYAKYPLRVTAEDVTGANALDQPARAKLSFADDITSAPSTITLNKNADLSSFVHEMGHFQLEMLAHISRDEALPEFGKDFDTVTKWLGTTPDAWRGMDLEQKREYHEQFARGFEKFLFEGKAPSEALRGVFQKVRAWMVNIYRSLSALNAPLSDEVRGVFNRLLATNDAIKQAEASRSFLPMFDSPEQAGMTPEQFADYHRLGQQATLDAADELTARTLKDMRFAENTQARALREAKKDVAAKRREVRAEVEPQIAAQPIYRAREFMKGEGKALDPEIVAEQFGFSSADELKQKLKDAEPLKEVVDAVTAQTMLERYGDITSPEALTNAANQAVHNEVRTRFVATELKALAKATGPISAITKAAREVAQSTIARQRVRDLSAAKYGAAEARAARASTEALRKGDTAQAAAQKRNQLLNNQLERAARAAATEVTKSLAYLRKFDTRNKSIDPEYEAQIQALLGRFDLRTSTSLTDLKRREDLREWVQKQTDQGLTPIIPDALLNEAYSKSYKDMTIEELNGLTDSVRNIEHLGRLKTKLLSIADKREFSNFVDEAAQTITDNAKKTLPERVESNQLGDKLRNAGSRFLANHRTLSSLLQQMDGKDGGFLWDKIVRPMNERGDWEARRRSESTKALHDIFGMLDKAELRQKTYIPEIDNSLSKEGRLSVALNWGNEVNQRRIMTGDKWSPAQVQAILRTLDKNDWAFVQRVWDHIDTYWPEIAEKQYRVTGVRPEKVEPQSFVNPLGETMAGGYYPIKYDPLRSSRAEADDEASTLKQMMGGAYTRATTRRGFTEARVDDVQRPVRKDLAVITNHVEEVLHDLAWHEWLIDANRIFASNRFGDAVRAHYGPETLSTMKDTLKSIAVGDVASKHAMDSVLAFLRKGTIVSRLGWNVVSALKQTAGVGPSAALIGTNYMRQGLMEYVGSAVRQQHVTDSVYQKSDFMRLRGQTLNRDIREVRNQIDAGSHPLIETISKALPAAQRAAPVVDGVANSYLWMVEHAQRHVDVPTWLGAYRKGINEFRGDEAKSIAYADQVVRDSQGSGLIADQAQIMRGGQLAKLFTTFYSAMNAQYNLLAKAKGQGGATKLAAAYTVAILLPSLYTSLLGTLRGHQGATDNDWWTNIAKDWGQELLGNTLGLGVGVRELTGIAQGFDYTGPTPLTPISDAGQLVKSAQSGSDDKTALLRAANKVGGDVLHYPAALVDRIAEGYIAWQNGDAGAGAMLIGKPTKQ